LVKNRNDMLIVKVPCGFCGNTAVLTKHVEALVDTEGYSFLVECGSCRSKLFGFNIKRLLTRFYNFGKYGKSGKINFIIVWNEN
jgi:hypothetical protein